MKMSWLTLLFTWLLLSCSKKNDAFPPDPVTPPVVTPPAETYTQYGTPYSEVPDASDASIYQVNMRAFSNTHNFKGVQARLDSIKALGINVLYLMPTYPVGAVKAVNSPYCVQDYNGVNSEFGSLDDLRALVAAAHSKHMAVLFDWVGNHTSWDNKWISNRAWYQQDGAGNIMSPPNTGWNDVAQLNFSNNDMRQAMIKAMKYWVYTANIDGYRCDAADFVPADFWKQAIDSLRNISTHKLLLFAEGTRRDHFTSGFNMVYGMGYYYFMVNNVYAKNVPAQSIDSVNNVEYLYASAGNRVVRYISNHDVDNSDGTPLDMLGGKKGSIAAFVTSAYMNAAPMIYNGQEVGCPVKLSFFNTSTTIDWTINADMVQTYKSILAFRNNSAAIRKGELASYSSNDVSAFTKTLGSEKVLVLVNLRNAAVTYSVPSAIANTAWKDAFSSAAVTVGNDVSLQPFEYKVLQKE